jgi:hypothetical protein
MNLSSENPNGIKFEGTNGWIFVSRGNVSVTATDPQQVAVTKHLWQAIQRYYLL